MPTSPAFPKTQTPLTDITIERLAAGGDGVGFASGKTCFVPYTAPGDRVRIRITRVAQKYNRGVVETLLEGGKERRPADCPIYTRCGGCNWLHLTEACQLQAKRGFLSRALQAPDADVTPSPHPLGYRGPARLHFRRDKGDVRLGFMSAAGAEIVDVDRCPILSPRLNDALGPLRAAVIDAGEDIPETGEIRLASGDEAVGATFRLTEAPGSRFFAALSALDRAQFSGVTVVAGGIETTVFGRDTITVNGPDDRPFFAPIGSFGQANAGINRRIAETVHRWLETRKFTRGVELFAGAGNLSITVAPHLRRLTVSELDAAACRRAEENLKQRGFGHVAVQQGDALAVFESTGVSADLVVLNPPRTGHRAVAQAAAEAGPDGVLYVSCNPATLARDVAEFQAKGYNLTEIKGFDMFPQTAHMEVAVLLER